MPRLAELSTAECWTRLAAEYTALVAFAHEGEVHVLPVNVCVRDHDVWFRAGDGVAQQAARSGARMAVAVERHDDLAHAGWSVAARGDAGVDADGPPAQGAPTVRPWRRGAQQGAWVRVAVDTITGRQLVLGPVSTATR